MTFRTQFERKPVKSVSGDRFVITYKPQYTETGALDLVESGKIDVYEQIQSYRESCDLQVILQRFQNGDVSALNQRLPYFADVSEMPTSLSGFLQLYKDAENEFANFPAELRAKFNNSPTEFFASLDSDRFDKAVNEYISEKAPVINNDVAKEVPADVPQPE